MTDLESAVDQLHAVPLEDFVAERKRLAKELRSAGERESAAELAKLPKPSAPAWALNSVARDEPDVVGGWLEAAETLRDASANADRQSGDALRAAIAAHREATRRVLVTVRERARPNGRELSEQMLDRVRELLQAATGDPARAELLRAGRVVEGDEEAPPLPEPKRQGPQPRARRAAPRPTAPPTSASPRSARNARLPRAPSSSGSSRTPSSGSPSCARQPRSGRPPRRRPTSGSRRRAARCTARSPRRARRARPPRRRRRPPTRPSASCRS